MTNITPTYNGAIPAFPQALSVNINYEGTPVLIDLSTNLVQGKINGVQTVFIDLMDVPYDVELNMEDTKQRIYVKAGTSGYYPVLASQLMKFKTKAKGPCRYNIIFINFPIAVGVWGQAGDAPGGDIGGGNGITELFNLGNGQELIVLENNNYNIRTIKAGNNITLDITPDGELKINALEVGTGGGGDESSTPYLIFIIENATLLNIPANQINLLDMNLIKTSSVFSAGINYGGASDALFTAATSGFYEININYRVPTESGVDNILIGTDAWDTLYTSIAPAPTVMNGYTYPTTREIRFEGFIAEGENVFITIFNTLETINTLWMQVSVKLIKAI